MSNSSRWYFYQIFHDQDTKADTDEQKSEPPEYFCIEFRVTLPTFLLLVHWLIATWSWVAETWVSEGGVIFYKTIILYILIKNFFISKKENYYLKA